MYSWEKEIKYFNEVYSFDPVDSKKMNIRYKPNFFISIKETPDKEEYDVFFAGKFSYHRLLMLDKLVEKFEKAGIKSSIILWPAYKTLLHNILIYSILKKLNSSIWWVKCYVYNYEAVTGILKRKFIINEKLAYKVIRKYALGSNVILDLPVESQTGYSHRLIDALATGKKIITTNARISGKSYYNPEQIKILNSADPDIDVDWVFKKDSFKVSQFIKELELTLWLKSIINVQFS